jgi:phage terminase small subunit
MPSNRTPTAVLDARGSKELKYGLDRSAEPTTDQPLGPPPSWLSKEVKAVWRSVAKQMLPGVVMHSDRDAFELLVRLTYKMRTDFDRMKGAEMSQLVSLFSRFAMTPADRSKVAVSKPKASAISKYLTPRAPRPAPVTAPPAPFEPAAPDLSVN